MPRQVTVLLARGAQGSRTRPGRERRGPAPSQNAGPSCLPRNHIPLLQRAPFMPTLSVSLGACAKLISGSMNLCSNATLGPFFPLSFLGN